MLALEWRAQRKVTGAELKEMLGGSDGNARVVPWLRTMPTHPQGVPNHGAPSDQTTRAVVIRTLHEVVLPGFEALGVAIGPGREWVEKHSSRHPQTEASKDS